MVKKKRSLHLYFSRIRLSYAVWLKSRIHFLPVLDKKNKGTWWFPPVDFSKSPSFSWFWLAPEKNRKVSNGRFPVRLMKFRCRDRCSNPTVCVSVQTSLQRKRLWIYPFDPILESSLWLQVKAGDAAFPPEHRVPCGPPSAVPPAQQHRPSPIALCIPTLTRTLRRTQLSLQPDNVWEPSVRSLHSWGAP